MAMWSESFNKELSAFFKEISDVIGKHLVNDDSIDESLRAYSPNSITRMVIGTTFGIAMQYILDPNDNEILDSLNVLQTVIK